MDQVSKSLNPNTCSYLAMDILASSSNELLLEDIGVLGRSGDSFEVKFSTRALEVQWVNQAQGEIPGTYAKYYPRQASTKKQCWKVTISPTTLPFYPHLRDMRETK